MFKRSNESEWARLSEGPGRRKAAAEAEGGEEPAQKTSAPVSRDADSLQADSPSTPSTPAPLQDADLGRGRAARPVASVRGTETVISEQSSFDGVFRTDEPIRVRGTMQGEVESNSFVIIEEQGRVTATVMAAAVTVAGQVDGKIVCTERVELMSTAHVTGEITAPTAIVRERAYFDGDLKTGTSSERAARVEVATKRGR